ncbi:MAG TPA: hypothetical protein VIV54_05980 [Burkholderiales bacterium]
MKLIILATAFALLAGCASLRDGSDQSNAARGATAYPAYGFPGANASPYPYNPPGG